MANEQLIIAYSEYLNTLNIHVLRNLARQAGVYKPTDGKKDSLIERTVNVLTGKVAPCPPSTRGAPLKDDALDPKYFRELERIREDYEMDGDTGYAAGPESAGEAAPEAEPEDPLHRGCLELLPNGGGMVRARNCAPTPGKDLFVSKQNLAAWGLREGDRVTGTAAPAANSTLLELTAVRTVNGSPDYAERKAFEDFAPCYPDEKIELSAENGLLSLRYIDLFAPVGKGQRALLCEPPGTDAPAIMRDILQALRRKAAKNENLRVFFLLLGECPEEVTEYMEDGTDDVVYTTFEKSAADHLRAARLVFAQAERLAEGGGDAVILLDSLTRLTLAASDACPRDSETLPCGLRKGCFDFPRLCLSKARNLRGAGSVTVIARLGADEGSSLDSALLAEYGKICNCRISLSGRMAQAGARSVVDVKRSGTRRAEKLLSDAEAACVARVQASMLNDEGQSLYAMMKQSPDNTFFIGSTAKY